MRSNVLIDTPVILYGSLNPDSVTARFLDKVIDGTLTPVVCPRLENEYQSLLEAPELESIREPLKDLLQALLRNKIDVEERQTNKEMTCPNPQVMYLRVLASQLSTLGSDPLKPDIVTTNPDDFPTVKFVTTPGMLLASLEAIDRVAWREQLKKQMEMDSQPED